MQCAFGTFCGVLWAELLGQSLWGAPLEVAPVSGVGLSPLDLDHAAHVSWEHLDLSGGGIRCCSLGCFSILFCTLIDRRG